MRTRHPYLNQFLGQFAILNNRWDANVFGVNDVKLNYYCAQLQQQERPMEPRPELGTQSFPNWGWQVQGSPHLPLPNSAASSGFSTAVGGAPVPSHPPAPFPDHQFYFPPTA
jgi:hypothetical protein